MVLIILCCTFLTIDCPPKVPPRHESIPASSSTGSRHVYSKEPGHKLQSPSSKPLPLHVHSDIAVVNTPTNHQERVMSKGVPPVIKPKPAGYRTYDSLNDNEEQVFANLALLVSIC